MTNKSEQTNTSDNIAKGTERGQQKGQQIRRHLSKTHVDVWYSRVRKRTYVDRKTGKVVEIPDWQVRLKKDGGESWFNLNAFRIFMVGEL
jgi:hypothetical protein